MTATTSSQSQIIKLNVYRMYIDLCIITKFRNKSYVSVINKSNTLDFAVGIWKINKSYKINDDDLTLVSCISVFVISMISQNYTKSYDNYCGNGRTRGIS